MSNPNILRRITGPTIGVLAAALIAASCADDVEQAQDGLGKISDNILNVQPPTTNPPETSTTTPAMTFDDLLASVDVNLVHTTEFEGFTYAWPAGRPHQGLYGAVDYESYGVPTEPVQCDPVPPNGCHHDETPAIDVFYIDAVPGVDNDGITGEPVRAITDGEIKYVNPLNTPGCSELKIIGNDGYDYYYTHLGQTNVTVGDRVTAGQVISAVGPKICVGGDYQHWTHPHLHLDAVVAGADSADKSNREPRLIHILNQLFSEMPR